MNAHLRADLWLLGSTVAICCVLYPLALWSIGQGVFPERASGSLIVADGKVIGSRLIAQPFTGPEHFWPRPSSASFDANASGGSDLSANNPKLRVRVVQALSGLDPRREAPADLVMASGSGLDPHITLSNAYYQLDRVAASWAKKTGNDLQRTRTALEKLLKEKASAPLAGLAGVPLVNVLERNLMLHRLDLEDLRESAGMVE